MMILNISPFIGLSRLKFLIFIKVKKISKNATERKEAQIKVPERKKT
jgi:hypothetical protein